MMDLEQRMTEIANRSERIFRKRRRRKRVAMACIPLVVCMAVLAGRYLQMNDAVQQEGHAEAVVEVVQGCMAYEIRDPEQVAQIGDLLESCMVGPGQESFIYGAPMGPMDGVETDDPDDMDAKPDGVEMVPDTGDVITVTLSDGTQHQYHLFGGLLTDKTTGKTVILAGEQVTQLQELLADRGE